MRSLLVAGLACLLAVGVASTATAAKTRTPKAPNLTALYNAAKQKGQTRIVVYHPFPSTSAPLTAAFERAYPEIKVQFITLAGLPVRARIVAERRSNNVSADVFTGPMTDLIPIVRKDTLQRFYPAKIASNLYGPNYTWAATTLVPAGVGVNTSRVNSSELPRTWDDVVNPRFRGRIGVSDLTSQNSSSPALLGAMYLKKVIDDRWLRALKANSPTVYGSAGALTTAHATGQIGLVVGSGPGGFFASQRGAPVAELKLREGNWATPSTMAILKGAKNVEAARLYIAWQFTAEAQRLAAQSAFIPVNPRVKPIPYAQQRKVHVLTYKQTARDLPRAIKHVQDVMGV